MIIRKSAAEIDGMARAGELVHETLQLVAEHLEPGVSMLELDRIADEHIVAHGGQPTSKGYKGFPAALCISPNSMVVHGIPTEYRAHEGDLISVDLGVTLNGLVADSAVTLPVGEIDAEAQRLLDACQEALAAGIEQAQPPGRGPVLQTGMTLAIEPMITAGGPDVYVHDDDWSISSVDSSLAAHFEHTVAITAEGPRILTKTGAALLR